MPDPGRDDRAQCPKPFRVELDPTPRELRPGIQVPERVGSAGRPTEWDRNDGFSPGAMVVTDVPGLDLAQTGAAPITDIGASLEANQPIALLDADTGERWPIWSELDSQADPRTNGR
ncbi:MAG: hypothetical protein FJW88_01725 [Actinobacteria bacterium]|nr:hypothetical protein [Actinomycetota bacterium]